VFLVSPQLLTSAILGVDIFINTSAIINFTERCALFKVDEETTRQLFDVTKDDSATISGNSASGYTEKDVFHVSILPLKTSVSPPIDFTTGEEHRAVDSETSIVFDNEGSTGFRESHAKCSDVIVHCNEYDTGSQSLEVRHDVVAADYSRGMEKESSMPVSSIAKDNEDHRVGELIREYDSENVETIAHATPNTAVNCFRTTTSDTYYTISAMNDTPDDRVITPNKLKAKISEYYALNENQRDQLLAVLMKYQPHLTKRPGKCNGFEYHFNIVGKLPKLASSRTIPFAFRDVRAQIQDMLIDGMLEESYSDYVNPLTLLLREHKPRRICVDARGVNTRMSPDRVKVAQMRELLQRFHGSRYITTLHFRSAFLQVL
jgi:hypothetical protein